MRAFGVLLLGLVGCSGSEFGAEDRAPSAGMGGELVAAGTGGSDAAGSAGDGVGGAPGGAGGAQETAGRAGSGGDSGGDGGTAGAAAGQAGGAMGGSGGDAGAEPMGGTGGTDTAGTGGELAGAGGSSAGTSSSGGAPGGSGGSGGSSGSGNAGGGAGGMTPSLEPQPAENCPGFVDYYVPVGTCIWFQGDMTTQSLECDIINAVESFQCSVSTASDVGPQTRRVKPGEQFMEPKRFDLVDGECPKVCEAP